MWHLLSLSLAAPPSIDPAHATNITVYHVNPHKSGAIPVNMDTGNAAGDLFFDLFEVLISPLACHQTQHKGHGCHNPEAVGKGLVVNKLTLEVDDRYSTCKPAHNRLTLFYSFALSLAPFLISISLTFPFVLARRRQVQHWRQRHRPARPRVQGRHLLLLLRGPKAPW